MATEIGGDRNALKTCSTCFEPFGGRTWDGLLIVGTREACRGRSWRRWRTIGRRGCQVGVDWHDWHDWPATPKPNVSFKMRVTPHLPSLPISPSSESSKSTLTALSHMPVTTPPKTTGSVQPPLVVFLSLSFSPLRALPIDHLTRVEKVDRLSRNPRFSNPQP